ncbi:TetR/AcrR family transcriptional regulator C-terminal domain-containing protein [Arthrobacter zhaoguopingii]|uniref:TetR/AcrR family transcriptional regulator C-terminal domain-containing protein n=1 Tax=Arthrobacter zhaoguopingii TaxID=2681491 RepID=UPI0013581A3A|nr:TetR/AcrR family transcriptional regulator C-terminal domain-containing protein [Arthrobacter zhaoguopingii]
MTDPIEARPRPRLNRARVLGAAVALADEIGIESLSMRRLAQELRVVPMALYKHVANKEELLDGMVDVIVGEIGPPAPDADWKSGVRSRVLSARRALQRHTWARRAIETRTGMTPVVLDYMDSFVGVFLAGGLSLDLTHHAMHALGGRMWGFTQELFEDPTAPAPAVTDTDRAEMLRQAAQRYPNVVAIATSVTHDEGSVVGHGCDDQFEFEFALDLLLDGFEQLHARGWTSQGTKTHPSKPEAAKTVH